MGLSKLPLGHATNIKSWIYGCVDDSDAWSEISLVFPILLVTVENWLFISIDNMVQSTFFLNIELFATVVWWYFYIFKLRGRFGKYFHFKVKIIFLKASISISTWCIWKIIVIICFNNNCMKFRCRFLLNNRNNKC